VIRLLRVFTPIQAARLVILKESHRRGLRCEFDDCDPRRPWACPLDAVYVGPPSTRVEGER
jgi:hypothetical protein